MRSALQVKTSAVVRSLGLLLLACGLTAGLRAQDILMSAPRDPVIPSVLRGQQLPLPASMPPAPPTTPFKFGPFVLHPRLSYGYMNAEGLPSPEGRRVASEIHTWAAGLSADLGDHWVLDYSPTWMNYTARAMTDSFDQAVSLSGATTFHDVGLRITESYSKSTPSLVETGRQTEQETWATSLSGSYSFNPKIQLQASGGVNERYTDILPRTRAWSSSATLNLNLSPRFSLNVGPTFTYTEMAQAPDTYDESYSAQVSWQPVEKLSLGLSAGRQFSHSKSAAAVVLSNPLLNFTLGYQPFETTTINFSASRTVPPSYFQRQSTDSVRWTIGLNQRLLGRLYFNASYAPFDTTYTATDDFTTVDRKDSVKAFNAGLSTQLFGRLGISATFSRTQNASTDSRFSFTSKQYGVRLSYSY